MNFLTVNERELAIVMGEQPGSQRDTDMRSVSQESIGGVRRSPGSLGPMGYHGYQLPSSPHGSGRMSQGSDRMSQGSLSPHYVGSPSQGASPQRLGRVSDGHVTPHSSAQMGSRGNVRTAGERKSVQESAGAYKGKQKDK